MTLGLAELKKRGAVSPSGELDRVAERYAVAVSPHLLALAKHSAGVARQFLPDARELVTTHEERADPIGDAPHSPVKGIVHRHRDRVLFKPVLACPVYCRFCFRREQVGQGDGLLPDSDMQAAFAHIESHPEIWEVIVTGGDPLILSARRAGALAKRIAAIPHVKILRWHSRVPVTEPARVTPELAQALAPDGITTYFALHANHPDEMTPEAEKAIATLLDAKITLVSQSVLLKGVNDDADTLEHLMRRFVELRVKPYYLHHPDLAPGTSHFRLPIARGRELMAELRRRLSGIAMPNYMLDIPGGFGKVPLNESHVEESRVRDPRGAWHGYLEKP